MGMEVWGEKLTILWEAQTFVSRTLDLMATGTLLSLVDDGSE